MLLLSRKLGGRTSNRSSDRVPVKKINTFCCYTSHGLRIAPHPTILFGLHVGHSPDPPALRCLESCDSYHISSCLVCCFLVVYACRSAGMARGATHHTTCNTGNKHRDIRVRGRRLPVGADRRSLAEGKYSTGTTVLDLPVHSYCKSQLRNK